MFEDWNEIVYRLKNIINESSEKIKEINVLSKELPNIGKKLNQDYEEIRKIGKAISEIQKTWKVQISPFINTFTNAIKDLPENLSYSQRNYLFEKGWYVSLDMKISAINEISNLIKENKIKEIEVILITYAKNLIPKVKKRVKKEFPHREGIISDAFQAHHEKRFALSIPVLLIQAEGICKEIIDISPYFITRKKGVKEIEQKIDNELSKYSIIGVKPRLDSYTELFLQQLLNETEITKSTKNMNRKKKIYKKYQFINRQSIIHGKDIDYPSEVNSLKAICFLNYIIELKMIFKKMNEFSENIKNSLK